jgi:hypothetical protein
MRCSKARERISDALDARLDERGGLDLSRHLDDCPDCRQHQVVLEQGQTLLRQDLIEPSDNFEWKVQLKIQQALREKAAVNEPVSGWRFWRPALASASGVALVVLVAGGLLLTWSDPVSGPVAPAPGMNIAAEQSLQAQPEGESEPDLSGAVRGQPLRINAASGGFGIRTVADQGFINSSPFAEPPRGTPRWRQEDDGESIEIRTVVGTDGRIHYIMRRWVNESGGSLNLKVHQVKLQKSDVTHERHEQPGS